MALTKYLVILFLVYLNFDISPLNSAAIPDRLDSSDSAKENDEATTANSEIDFTTGATDDDIGKIFETYENLYIKNSNWFNDDELVKNLKSEKSPEIKPEEESTSRDLEPTEPTADDVVETIHNIMDEKIDAKSNRTDRTIVVVVTTNVFNINGSDDSGKRQHTLLSFGTPGMMQKETSTDATLAMHNRITTEFFNSNYTPINEPTGINDNEKSIVENSEAIGSDDSLDDSDIILPVTENEESLDVSTTEKPSKQDEDNDILESLSNIDIRQLRDSADIQDSRFKPTESRSFVDALSNDDDSNDILRVIKIIPSDDERSSGSLSKPFELPVEEPADSSLMEAIENILDTDVRKAFERDIPQTRHVPLDINIEEETLYAPLKDMREYIIEEIPFGGNYGLFKDNDKTGELLGTEQNVERVEPLGGVKTDDIISSTDAPTTRTTEESKTTRVEEEVTTTTTTKEETIELTKTTEEETIIADGNETNSANQQTDNISESEEYLTTTTNGFFGNDFEAKITDMRKIDEVTGEETPKLVEVLQSGSETLEKSDTDELSEKENITGAEPFEANKIDGINNADDTHTKPDIHEDVSENSKITNHANSDNIPSATIGEQQDEFVSESFLSIESDRQSRHSSGTDTFEEAVELPVNQYRTIVNADTTDSPTTKIADLSDVEDFVDNSHMNTDASPSNVGITTILEVEKNSDKIEKEFVGTDDVDKETLVNFIVEVSSTTTKPVREDVVSEVVKVDEETTELHQIIKKPGVDGTISVEAEIKTTKVTTIESNNLVATKTTNFESRSFSDNDDTVVDPLRTLVEGVELTAEITKTVDNFQSLIEPNDSIPFAANQVVENPDDMALVKNDSELNSTSGSVWCATAIYLYTAGGILLILLIVLLGIFSYLRFRQFKRNILFTC